MEHVIIEAAVFLAAQAVSTATILGSNRARLRAAEKRLDIAEDQLRNLPLNYVPRTEVHLALSGIKDTTRRTEALLQGLFLGRRRPTFDANSGSTETIAAAADTLDRVDADLPSCKRLALVHPSLAAKVHAAMAYLAERGTYFRVAQGLRTYAEQDALFDQGRTTPGHIVTNARGGFSNHNFGCAVDCYPFLSGPSGDLNWNSHSFQFEAMVEALKAQGLIWGGDWHSLPDAPHFQLANVPVTPTEKDREAFIEGGLEAVWRLYPA